MEIVIKQYFRPFYKIDVMMDYDVMPSKNKHLFHCIKDNSLKMAFTSSTFDFSYKEEQL